MKMEFDFIITENEYLNLKSNFLTSNLRGGSIKEHTVFIELVAMLATIKIINKIVNIL